ncbi:zincin-like metallopeptidase domain-containing protein [Bradyrhizobium sp. CCBAU 11434]|uniref:zincin-like metallopeptidase domain-containing protein n=1 Tax=Bradyrhizobium sp. CCBAU 11434 TaxID=1630885 RepID=UPI0023068AD2|nr:MULTISPECIES: zincin-like metallopeptidase domain-containing protein [unclassified Bradyrhizobium]
MDWTGPEHRCDRQLSGRFGTDAYAMEELVAELGAAFLCAEPWNRGRAATRPCAVLGALAERPEGRQAGHLLRSLEGW